MDEQVDVLVSTANVQLNMSGGVNGEILRRGGQAVQEELHAYLAEHEIWYVAPGTVLETDPGPVCAQHLLHAVAVDAFYDSSIALVTETIIKALTMASACRGETVALPALATGYGPLAMSDFAQALRLAVREIYPGIRELRGVLRREQDVEVVEEGLTGG